MVRWLRAWFHERGVELTGASDEDLFATGAIDSLSLLELIAALEKSFAIKLTDEDLQDPRFGTIAGLAAIVAARTSRS